MVASLNRYCQRIPSVDDQVGQEAARYVDTLTKPKGSLGRLEAIAVELAKITGHMKPQVSPPGIIVFAADHGIAAEGVSAYPQEVTAQMVHNFLNGGAAINVFARQIGAMLEVVDIGVAQPLAAPGLISRKVRYGTANFLKETAMSLKDAVAAIEVGIERAEAMIDRGIKSLIVGEMGIGNTTTSSAMLAAFLCGDTSGAYPGPDTTELAERMKGLVGPGTGVKQERVIHKQSVIARALALHRPNGQDPVDVLSKVGGLEIAGMAGAILAAARHHIPVIVDGFICTVAALTAVRLCPHVNDVLLAAHRSQEPGHQVALRLLNKEPLVDLGMRLGEGSGAAVAFPLVEAACRMIGEMATFQSAGVTDGEGA
ncbi:nicotinate-nucleotide--dimethylbenzimidazole phosphoribosyltransferase [Caldalkalibacillus uzonensis]|uniref:Nicotinate-nucleotide--dimethylbenzimidazole phosphoribosyltransferase n=1 Tax=Caldalkalibacillus uzonensis TaxID=353224 RepID=A0ABU0CPN3_9BACI|nr:nicotinate-nucleotide--dimethylbenzimidazole phosphoribosyltransferase [Caldalkalibacillus uzonensis]MDQ0338383.1 nicotinate-nucleotide--dimethylbenzimidazole phosphoribosyltransferase [Caldalkalibacillus uzonensis]